MSDELQTQNAELQHLPEKYELKITDPTKTGIRLFKLTDKETGIVTYFVEYNEKFDVHAGMAFAAAKTSRSDKTFEDIFALIYKAIKEGRYTPGAKLADIFTGEFEGYGHSSVGDLTSVMLRIEGIPIFEAFNLFNSTSVGAGQELSTRYVAINEFNLPPLKNLVDLNQLSEIDAAQLQELWDGILLYCEEQYARWTKILTERLDPYLSSQGDIVDKKTLAARVLDIARMFLPTGAGTVVSLLTSARGVKDLIVQSREDNSYHGKPLGDQLFHLLNLQNYVKGSDIHANLGGLLKYAEPKFTIKKNLDELKSHLEKSKEFQDFLRNQVYISDTNKGQSTSVKKLTFENIEDPTILMIMQYILVLYPDLPEEKIIEFLMTLPDTDNPDLPNDEQELSKSRIGEIIFRGHDHHNLLRNMGDVRGQLFIIETAMAYVRDINRHRAFGRFVPIIETRDFATAIATGFNENYQIKNMTVLRVLQEAWDEAFGELYRRLEEILRFVEEKFGENVDTSFLMNLLPLGHQTKLHLSGPLTQLIYLICQRIAPGGDFGYRVIAEELLKLLQTSPFLIHILPDIEIPDPNSIKQNLDRR